MTANKMRGGDKRASVPGNYFAKKGSELRTVGGLGSEMLHVKIMEWQKDSENQQILMTEAKLQ